MSRPWHGRAPLLLVGVALVAGLAVMGVSRAREAAQADRVWARVQRAGLLRVGMDASYPPFEVVDADGTFYGLDVDLARALGQRWGVEVELVNIHFDGLYDALHAGRIDLIVSALPYDRTLTRDLLYSQAYFDAGQVVIVYALAIDGHHGGDVAQVPGGSAMSLAGQRVAVELGSEGHLLARRLLRDRGLDIDLLALREPHELQAAMREGQVNAVLCDRVQAYSYLGEAPGWVLLEPPLTEAPYVMASAHEARELIRQVDLALDDWRADGTWDTIVDRWFR